MAYEAKGFVNNKPMMITVMTRLPNVRLSSHLFFSTRWNSRQRKQNLKTKKKRKNRKIKKKKKSNKRKKKKKKIDMKDVYKGQKVKRNE